MSRSRGKLLKGFERHDLVRRTKALPPAVDPVNVGTPSYLAVQRQDWTEAVDVPWREPWLMIRPVRARMHVVRFDMRFDALPCEFHYVGFRNFRGRRPRTVLKTLLLPVLPPVASTRSSPMRYEHQRSRR